MAQHNVHDTDPRFTVDPIKRAIVNVSQKKTVLIQGDHNSERFTFEIPRYIEGHDMSQCNKVEIHYINIDAVTKAQHEDVYECADFAIDAENEDKVTCSWLISANATQYVGSLTFAISLKCLDGDTLLYRWNTAPNTTIRVSDGINNTDIIIEEYSDILQEWWNRLYGNATMLIELVTVEELETLAKEGKIRGDTLYLFKNDPALALLDTLEQAVSKNTQDIAERVKTTDVIDIAHGGTGGTTAEEARKILNLIQFIRYKDCAEGDETIDGGAGCNKTSLWISRYKYKGSERETLNSIGLFDDKTTLDKPLTVESGGTGGTTKEKARENLGIGFTIKDKPTQNTSKKLTTSGYYVGYVAREYETETSTSKIRYALPLFYYEFGRPYVLVLSAAYQGRYHMEIDGSGNITISVKHEDRSGGEDVTDVCTIYLQKLSL